MQEKKLKPEQLKMNYDIEKIKYDEQVNIEDNTYLVFGQERGIQAFEFGLEIDKKGYNIYFEGPTGLGKTMYVKKFLAKKAKLKKELKDYVYVNNFEREDEPVAIELEAGGAKIFKENINRFVKIAKEKLKEIVKEEGENQEGQKGKEELKEKKKEIILNLNLKTKPIGFEILEGPKGVFMLPVKNGRTLTKEQYEKLKPSEKVEYEQKSPMIQELLLEALTKMKELEIIFESEKGERKKMLGHRELENILTPLKQRYAGNAKIIGYLENIKRDMLDNIDEVIEPESSLEVVPRINVKERRDKKYDVNIFVDNSETEGAPLIMDINYSFENIFGKVEYENEYGIVKTNYMKVKSGLIHKANGGYIVFQARELLTTPMLYETLKKVLKIEEVGIETSPENRMPMVLTTLKPEPIPLKVKVVIIGPADVYNMLVYKDLEFNKLFRVKTEFDDVAEATEENAEKICQFISSYVKQERTKPVTKTAVKELLEYASELAGSKQKFATNFAEIGRVIIEASLWAEKRNQPMISKEDIERVFEERKLRVNKYNSKYSELIEKEFIIIDVEGKAVGEINGLSVSKYGTMAFGQPVKITANTYLGVKGVVNIEKEVQMAGPIHNKGIGVITGYLGEKFAQKQPLTMTANIVFEQTYSGIDGDSASSTEIYAILSSLANVGIKQSIAVTGSVNQKGKIQPIGGVNEKITGFFEICKRKGLDGSHGCIIPKQNVDNLSLSREIVQAVKEGLFNIYAVSTIDEGIEILTGIPAGREQADGTYPKGTINYLVAEKLNKYYQTAKNATVKEKNEK